MTETEQLLTPDEVALILRRKVSTIQRYARTEVIPSIRVRGRILFRQSDVDIFIDKKSINGRGM